MTAETISEVRCVKENRGESLSQVKINLRKKNLINISGGGCCASARARRTPQVRTSHCYRLRPLFFIDRYIISFFSLFYSSKILSWWTFIPNGQNFLGANGENAHYRFVGRDYGLLFSSLAIWLHLISVGSLASSSPHQLHVSTDTHEKKNKKKLE